MRRHLFVLLRVRAGASCCPRHGWHWGAPVSGPACSYSFAIPAGSATGAPGAVSRCAQFEPSWAAAVFCDRSASWRICGQATFPEFMPVVHLCGSAWTAKRAGPLACPRFGIFPEAAAYCGSSLMRMLRNDTVPWSPWRKIGPGSVTLLSISEPVALLHSTLS